LIVQNCRVWEWFDKDQLEGGWSGTSITIKDGRFVNGGVGVGDGTNNDCRVVDAGGRCLLPGLIDSHIHVQMLGETRYMLNLSSCTSIKGPGGLIEAIAAHMKKYPEASNVVGVHWDQEKLGRFPSSKDLDSVCPTKPCWLWRSCWHIGVGNSKVLSACKAEEWKGEGGVVERDEDGRLTGILKERACEIVSSALGEIKEEEKIKLISEGLDLCRTSGLTTVQSNELNKGSAAYEKLQREGKLKTRVFMTPMCDELDVTEPPLPRVVDEGRMLSFNRVKIFGDGSLGAGTAAIEGEREKGKGVLINTDEEMVSKIKLADSLGWRLEIHAIGDLAATQVLDALEEAGVGPDKRPILTHCQVLSEDLIRRMNEMNVIANVQPSFVPTDMEWVEKRLTKEKQEWSYCWKTLIQQGVRVAGGSDAPVESPSPLLGMYDAMRRMSRTDGRSFRPEESLTFSQALAIYTLEGAYACGAEEELGSIENGYIGDCVLVEDDEANGWERLKDMKPWMVVVGGEVVYEENAKGRREEGEEEREKSEGPRLEGPFIPGKGGGFFCACVLRGKACNAEKSIDASGLVI